MASLKLFCRQIDKLKEWEMRIIAITLFTGFLITGIFAQSSASSTTQGIKEDAREAKTAIKTESKDVKPKVKAAAKDVKEAAKAGARKVKAVAKEVKQEVKEAFGK